MVPMHLARRASFARSGSQARAWPRWWAALSLTLLALGSLLAPLPVRASDPAPTATAPTATNPAPTTPPTSSASAGAAFAIPAYRQAKNVAIITIQGEIDGDTRLRRSVLAQSVERRIRAAERAGADALVFEIDSPGGEVGASLRIAQLIKNSSIQNTVAWVRPQALSGGAIIALACRELVVDDPVQLGDAMPIQISPTGPRAVTDPSLLKKILPPLIGDLLDSARRHNTAMGLYQRDEYLMKAIVANDVELWWVRNPTTGVELAIDRSEFEMLFPGQATGGPTRLASAPGSTPRQAVPATTPGVPSGSAQLATVAPDLQQRGATTPTGAQAAIARPTLTPADAGKWVLVDKVLDGSAPATFNALDLAHYNLAANRTDLPDGTTVLQPIRTDADLKAFFGATNLQRFDRWWSESLVTFLTTFWVRGVLIAIFLLALFVEMSHPGAILPGIVSLLALGALIAPPMLIGLAGWWEVVAIIVGIVLLAIEAFVLPGFGVAGILGMVFLFGGLLATFVPSGGGLFPGQAGARSDLLYGALTIVAALITSGVGIFFLAKYFGSLPVVGRLVIQDPAPGEVAGTLSVPPEPDVPLAVGDQGVTITPMHPAGRVELDEGARVIDAVSDFGFLPPRTRVRVTSIDGIRVGVERIGAQPGGGGSAREASNG